MNKRTSERPWQLPDGIDELLPGAASRVESLRTNLLGCARRWGYQLVMPPMVEFTDSLLVGVGEDLDRLTYKVPDQLSGRMLGFRADITPQVARIDAHSLRDSSINRLCYAGSTLHTRPGSLAASRSPLQLGAELYGEASLAGDIEVIDLMLTMLSAAGVAPGADLTLDLGHAVIFRELISASDLNDASLEADLHVALQRKSKPELKELSADLPQVLAAQLTFLMDAHGGISVLDRARETLGGITAGLDAALDELKELSQALASRHPELAQYIDLAELRGYRYHTGVVFAAYTSGLGESLARGGRYDDVSAVYGRSRPATGFATDLRVLAELVDIAADTERAIAMPDNDDPELLQLVSALRESGECVIRVMSGVTDPRCDRELVRVDTEWQVQTRACSTKAPEGE